MTEKTSLLVRCYKCAVPNGWGPVDGGWLITIAWLLFVEWLAFQPSSNPQEYATKLDEFINSPTSQIGDTLAGVFAVLALVWIIVTVFLQSHELKEQRNEIRTTNVHLEKQNFDNFFFELVATHNSIVESIDIRKKTDGILIRQGRDCFGHFLKDIQLDLDEKLYPNQSNDLTFEKYDRMYQEHHSDLGHYFRFVYNSLRAIEETNIAQKKHKRLFRALFSDDELLILFYNSLSKHGEKLIPLIESFEFFDNLPQERLVYEHHKSRLKPVCFGETE